MTLGIDWGPIEAAGALLAAAAAICGPALSSLYVRGKLDAHAKNASDRLEEFGKKVEALEKARANDGENKGAQTVLNANAVAAAQDARTAREMVIAVDARQALHEKGCDQRQTAIEGRFDKTDIRLDHLATEIRNLALGIADTVQHVPASAKRP